MLGPAEVREEEAGAQGLGRVWHPRAAATLGELLPKVPPLPPVQWLQTF